MTTAVYPGTFDPLTRGHQDIVRRASSLFERVILAVAASPNKNPLFSLSDRVEIASEVFSKDERIVVMGFEGLLKDVLKQNSATVIGRGLRAVCDFEFECQMAGMNRQLLREVELVF